MMEMLEITPYHLINTKLISQIYFSPTNRQLTIYLQGDNYILLNDKKDMGAAIIMLNIAHFIGTELKNLWMEKLNEK